MNKSQILHFIAFHKMSQLVLGVVLDI